MSVSWKRAYFWFCRVITFLLHFLFLLLFLLLLLCFVEGLLSVVISVGALTGPPVEGLEAAGQEDHGQREQYHQTETRPDRIERLQKLEAA